jgi:LysR family nitrogen assimilation transcriptional regulator
MDLRQLSHFVRVAEAGSFSSAAAALMLSQPTLSRQVALLETELGQRLLTRTGLATPLARPSTRLTRKTTDLLRDLDLQALDRVGG